MASGPISSLVRLAGRVPDPWLGKLEKLISLVRGKGAGAGWDLECETAVAARLIKRKVPVIIDVGAHHGEWSLALGSQLERSGVHGEFHLVEPSPSSVERLRALQRSDFRLHPVALGRKQEERVLFEPAPGSLLSSLHRRSDSFLPPDIQCRETSVPVVTLDELLASLCVDTVDFLKLDTEGHELEILIGAEKSFMEGKIQTLSFEFGSANVFSRTYFRDYWDLLSGKWKFQISRIRPGGSLHAVNEYSEELEFFRGATNYVAIRKPSHGGTVALGVSKG